jgi:type IV pilus biogenesis protein CpaD/CtpE
MKKTMPDTTTLGRTLLLGFAAAALIGCAKDPVSYKTIAGDVTPDMQGYVERPVDVDRHLVYTNNTNLRAASDDLGRAFYTDHPSRLTPFPTVYTSGMPR